MKIKYTKEELFKFVKLYYQKHLGYSDIDPALTFVKTQMKNGHNKYVPAIAIKEQITIGDIPKEGIEILSREELITILNAVHTEYGFEIQNLELIGENYKLTGNDLKEVIVEISRLKKESLNK